MKSLCSNNTEQTEVRHLSVVRILALCVFCVVLLGACGQKGDLVLPDPPPAEHSG